MYLKKPHHMTGQMRSKDNFVSLSVNDVCSMDDDDDDDDKGQFSPQKSELSSSALQLQNGINHDFSDSNSTSSRNSSVYNQQIIGHFFSLERNWENLNKMQKTTSSITLTESTRMQYENIWAGSINLKRTAKPHLANVLHLENSLKVTISEAKNVSAKRYYYCDLCLDRTLYARTTRKAATSGVFWAEEFNLNNLPNVSVMTIKLYKDTGMEKKEGKRICTSKFNKRKYKKAQNQLIGFFTIPVSEITDYAELSKWVVLQTPIIDSSQDLSAESLRNLVSASTSNLVVNQSNNSNTTTGRINSDSVNTDQRNLPQLRISVQYKSLQILPASNYKLFKELLIGQSQPLTLWLESAVSVKMKQELTNSLVCFYEYNDMLIDYLTKVVVREISALENESMTFRGNTMGTKAVENYVKFVSPGYLSHVLHLVIQHVLNYHCAWEVDPEKHGSSSSTGTTLTATDTAKFSLISSEVLLNLRSSPNSLMSNQLMLLQHLNLIWRAIQSSVNVFPVALTKLFASFRAALEPERGIEFCDKLISSCIFLRLICPAILSPSLFGLAQAYPSEPACIRNLTLLAKSLQSMANFTTFDDKESYMRFLNGYVLTELPHMRTFLRSISTFGEDQPANVDKKSIIDENYELANLHLLLFKLYSTEKTKEKSSILDSLPESLTALPYILNEIELCSKLVSKTIYPSSQPMGSLFKRVPSSSVASNDVQLDQTTLLPDGVTKLNSLENLSRFSRSNNNVDSEFNYCGSQNNLPSYFTLHYNPGYQNTLTGSKSEIRSNLLIESNSAQGNNSSNAHLNEYDEPCLDADSENETDEKQDSVKQSICDTTTTTNNNGSSESISKLQKKKILFDPVSLSSMLQSQSKDPNKCLLAVINQAKSDQEHIYDSVPLSASTSADDLTKSNKETGTATPVNGVDKLVEIESSSSPTQFTNFTNKENYNRGSDVQGQCDHNHLHKTTLSPRLFQKQVAKANVILTKTNIQDTAKLVHIQKQSTGQMVESDSSSNLQQIDDRNCTTLGSSIPKSSGNTNKLALHNTSPSQASADVAETNTMDFKYNQINNTNLTDLISKPDGTGVDLFTEIVRLRYELLLSREDALRSADRLSKQETEIYNLRLLLEQLRSHQHPEHPSESATYPGRDQSVLNGNSNLNAVKNTLSQTKFKGLTNPTSGDTVHTVQNITSAFKELDEAMARLNQEQAELFREQSRIKARLSASRPHPTSTAIINSTQSNLNVARSAHISQDDGPHRRIR